jgi:hypothetical protein
VQTECDLRKATQLLKRAANEVCPMAMTWFCSDDSVGMAEGSMSARRKFS